MGKKELGGSDKVRAEIFMIELKKETLEKEEKVFTRYCLKKTFTNKNGETKERFILLSRKELFDVHDAVEKEVELLKQEKN